MLLTILKWCFICSGCILLIALFVLIVTITILVHRKKFLSDMFGFEMTEEYLGAKTGEEKQAFIDKYGQDNADKLNQEAENIDETIVRSMATVAREDTDYDRCF